MPTENTVTQDDVVRLLREKAQELIQITEGDQSSWNSREWRLVCQDYCKYADYLDDLARSIEHRNITRREILTRARSMPFVPSELWRYFDVPIPE